MDTLYSPATVAKLINKHDFRFARSLGQNFLIDGNIVNKIVESAAIASDDFVIEIGTGLGVLTKAVAAAAAEVVSIEIDKRLFPILAETLRDEENVKLINGDFLKVRLGDIICNQESFDADKSKGSIKIIGNLPYYISSPIIMKVLEENEEDNLGIESLTIMVQKEVGQRLNAKPGSKDYGILSVAVQYYTEITSIFAVSKTVFMPKPDVDSIVLTLKLRKKPPVVLESVPLFFEMVKTAFGKRRKAVSNALMGFKGLKKEDVAWLLKETGIEESRRPETIDIVQWGHLSNKLSDIMKSC